MQWFAQEPSNIALIKYMGKRDDESNLPINPSFSYTISNLQSSVFLEQYSGHKDIWEPLEIPGTEELFILSPLEQARYIFHLERLKNYFNYKSSFIIRSTNNFPARGGLASSASSFAALTKCACLALSELQQVPLPTLTVQAQLSRLGSGSSCRSFFAPWALWQDDLVSAIDLPYKELHHEVVIISHNGKRISSSEAHKRVKDSPQFAMRPQRATENLKTLLIALETQAWQSAYSICWREFHDMHQLFSSCSQPFSYITPNGEQLLCILQDFWAKEGDGPIITMDAGPNIHLLYRLDQMDLARKFKREHLITNYDIL